MSQDIKFNFDRMLESDPTMPSQGAVATSIATNNHYPDVSNTRNLGFIWLDGRRLFLNYSYLVSGEYRPAESAIHLAFTTHEVLMIGVGLDNLFEELMSHLPRLICCADERYNAVLEQGQYAVNMLKIDRAS